MASSERLSWPVDGVVVSRFGRWDGLRHDGIDIAAPLGTPVFAAAAGTVVFAGERDGYGRLLILSHGDRRVTVYAQNHANCVRQGDRVKRGQQIATVGDSGGARSPALYFEFRNKGRALNPRRVLP